jgi:tetratricopeptide (TPR) repeat protein
MTRLTAWLAVGVVLLPGPAAAQRTRFVEGLTDLSRAMMLLAENHAQVNAAIDRMAAALDAWDVASAPPAADTLLGDEAAAIPVLPLAAYADAFARLRRGEYREAIVSLRRAAAVATDEREPLAAAAQLAQEGRHLEAERALRSIVTTWPESGVAHWWLGRVYENINRVADARREYEVVESVALTGRGSIQTSIGRLAFTEGDLTRAAEAFERRLRLTPNDPLAHKHLAWTLIEQDRTDTALVELGAVVAIDPRDAEAHAAIGRIRLDGGYHAEAILALRRALDLRPALYEARYALALALKATGRGDEAAREMESFERARREATDERRRTMAVEAQRQERARQDDAARQDRAR